MTFNIATSIAVDKDLAGKDVHYWSLGETSGADRRAIYWKCVAVFCWISTSVNAGRHHIVFSNDDGQVVIDGFDVKDFLRSTGVELIALPFERFDPHQLADAFRNAFYKLEVLSALSELSQPSILLDSDVIWHRRSPELDELLSRGDRLLLQDTYQRSGTPDSRVPHDLSMRDMGSAFRQIDPSYPTDTPTWWGGELIAAGPALLREIASLLLTSFSQFTAAAPHVRFPNGHGILDNDEYLASYVFNRMDVDVVDTYGKFSRRICTLPGRVDAWHGDRAIPIWHMLNEKRRGFEMLFRELRAAQVPFAEWRSRGRLGDFVGVPRPDSRSTWLHRPRPRGDVRFELKARLAVRRNKSWNP